MSLKGTRTTTSFIPWDTFIVLLNRLEKEGNYRFVMIMALGVFTGLRISDIKQLKWYQILNKSKLKITEKKTKKYREIPINKTLAEIANRIYNKINISNPNSLIVENKYGNPLSTQYINIQLKLIFTKNKIPLENVSTHMLRKTMGRRIWEYNDHSEKSLILLSQIFNHSSLAITKRYLGITETEINNVYELLTL